MPPNHRLSSPGSFLTFSGLVDACFFMVACGSWLGLLGRWHWALDLFSHFRWQYVILCALGVTWCLWHRRSRRLLGICVATLFLNGIEVARVMGNAAFSLADGRTLRVISLNVLTGNPDKQAVFDYLRTSEADVIFLMEVDEAWARALEGLKATHPHVLMHPREDNFGVAVLSRVGLTDLRLLLMDEAALPSITARVIHAGRELVIVGTHPLPPIGGRLSARRDAQLQRIAGYVAAQELPVLLVGDLNATPWSHGMTLVTRGTGLAYRSADPAWTPTWKVGTPFAIPIDHALCTPPLMIVRREIGPGVGSDHRPQEIDVAWEP